MAKDKDNDKDEKDPMEMTDRDLMVRLTMALENLGQRAAANPQDGHISNLIEKLTTTMERVASAQVEGAQIIASENKKAFRPSNEIVPACSVFNRRGVLLPDDAEGPRKPQLKAICMVPWLIEWESINREEAELLNLLIDAGTGEYTLKRIDNSKIHVIVKVDYKLAKRDDMEPEPYRLLLNHDTAFNNDNKDLMPAFTDLLRQLLRQAGGRNPDDRHLAIRKASMEVLSDEEEEMLIEAGELSVSV